MGGGVDISTSFFLIERYFLTIINFQPIYENIK